MANSQNLEDMKLPELKELAKQMGLRGTSTMRKPELLATLQAARNGGEPPAGVTVRAPKAAKTAKVVKAPQSDAAEASTTDNADVATQSLAPAPAATEPQLDLPLPVADDAKKDETEPRRTRRKAADDAAFEPRAARRRRDDDQSDFARRKPRKKADEAGGLLATLDLGDAAPTERRRERHEDVEVPLIRRVRDDEDEQPRRRRRTAENSEETVRDLDDILATLPTQKHEETSEDGEQNDDHEFVRRNRRDRSDRNDRDNRNDRNDRRNRRMRGRDRDNADDDRRYDDRDNRSDRNDRDSRREEPQEDLVPVAGIVDVLDSYAFVRTSGYLPGPNDVYVSMGQVKKYGLRKGDAVHGSIRAPREGDRRNQRQKFVPLQAIDSINGQSVEDALNRPQFSKLTPLYPQERLKQETAPNKLTGRIMDIVSPIGKGQRGLIVSPPKAGKTITLQNIANSIAANNPEVHLMVVLVDERPEEVTDMERTVQGEVISSTFDRPASDHTTVAELAIERAKRLVELGQDVVVLLDSMTRLAGGNRLQDGRGDFRGVQGHRQHGAAPVPRAGGQATVPGHRHQRFRHPPRGAHHQSAGTAGHLPSASSAGRHGARAGLPDAGAAPQEDRHQPRLPRRHRAAGQHRQRGQRQLIRPLNNSVRAAPRLIRGAALVVYDANTSTITLQL